MNHSSVQRKEHILPNSSLYELSVLMFNIRFPIVKRNFTWAGESLKINKGNVNSFPFILQIFQYCYIFPYQISLSEPARTRQPYLSLFVQSHDNSRTKMLQFMSSFNTGMHGISKSHFFPK